MILNEHIEIARKNWIKASISLEFKLITPYLFEVNGKEVEVFAFLPEYGSPNGTIVCLTTSPNFDTDQEVISLAKENEVYYSFVNIESFQKYDEDYFREILEDWVKI